MMTQDEFAREQIKAKIEELAVEINNLFKEMKDN
jgi:hypothetical protein